MADGARAYCGGFGIVTGTAGEYGCSFDPVANARAAAGYVAARYRPLTVSEAAEIFVPLLDSGYVAALGRIRERHDRIVRRVRLYAELADALGEPPSRFLSEMVDAVADELSRLAVALRLGLL